MLNYNDYINGTYGKNTIAIRISKQGFYDINAAEKNFNRVLIELGSEPSTDQVCLLTVRLKNRFKVKRLVDEATINTTEKTDYRTACSVASALQKKITRRFWKRKGRNESLPMVFSIESSKDYDKEHIHAIIRFSELKQYFSNEEITSIIRKICNSLDEINEKDHTAIDIRMIHYCEDLYGSLGHAIEYICKTSANYNDHQYDPIYSRK